MLAETEKCPAYHYEKRLALEQDYTQAIQDSWAKVYIAVAAAEAQAAAPVAAPAWRLRQLPRRRRAR